MMVRNAVDWHTHVAINFDKKYSNSGNFKERYSIWTEIFDQYSNDEFHVLDVGCGSGVFTFYLADKNKTVIGLDASTEMLKICQQKMEKVSVDNIDFLNCNVNSLGENIDKKADMVVSSSVLEYIADLDKALSLIVNTMNKNGLFIFSMPNKQSIYRKIEQTSFDLFGRPRYYKYVNNVCSLKEMENKLETFGFSILKKKYYGKTPFLSQMLRKMGISHYSDNLFVIVARLSS